MGSEPLYPGQPQVKRLSPACSLSHTGIEAATAVYATMDAGAPPSTLLVPLDLVWEAYRLLPDQPHKLLIVPVPGMPSSMWGVCGAAGAVLSPF